MNKILDFGSKIDSVEIFLRIIQIDNSNDQNKISMLIKSILNQMNEKGIVEILKYLSNTKYLNIIKRLEVIFRHIIIEKNMQKYKNNEEIKNILYNMYKDLLNSEINLNFEADFEKCVVELVSILVQLSDNYILNEDFFEVLEIFLKKRKKDKLIIDIFRALFFEIYDSNMPSTQYIENSKDININKFKMKPLDSDLFSYLCKIIEFIQIFNPIKEIVFDLLSFLDKIYTEYEQNINSKNNSDYICIFTHIFNCKKIISGIFQIVCEYQNMIIQKEQKEIYIKNIFKNYHQLISYMFHHCKSPSYLFNIRNYLNDEKNFEHKLDFCEEIIKIISLEKEIKNDTNKNKYFYQNLIELLEILWISTNLNKLLAKNKKYENIFIIFFNWLKKTKIIFSPYIITINDFKKTIMEYCFDISIQINIYNFSNLFYNDNDVLNYIIKNKNFKEKDNENDGFNKYLKTLKNKISEKPILIYILNILCDILNSNKFNNSDSIEQNAFEKYLNIFIDEIKKNDIWKKYEKDNEELKIIKNSKNSELVEFINYIKKKNENKEKIRNQSFSLKRESKKNNLLLELDENNECPAKKNCLLMKNKSNINIQLKLQKTAKTFEEDKVKKYGSFLDFDLENIILCIKRDILLKESSIYFYEMYFNDKNFKNLKDLFLYKYEHHKKIKLTNEMDKLNYPVTLKNYANNKYAYPQMFFKPYSSFYNNSTFEISHSYFNRNLIKKPSFPYLPEHYFGLETIIKNDNKEIFFNEECELIMKTYIICGNLFLNEKMLYFINNNEIIKKYGKDMKYLFSSLKDDVRTEKKIVIIKLKDIEEIISRRFVYEYRANEIFLKNGKSYYFNLYSKEINDNFFDTMEKFIKSKKLDNITIIREPIKYFHEKNYSEKWANDKMSTYQYLLFINKFSSRSYLDINQYPIFPWIFREITFGSQRGSDKIPRFRDLEFPISIKGKSLDDNEAVEENKEEAKCFFDANLDENSKYPSHFRLHYSTSGYLLSFLVRVSPYTEEQIRFQNKQFDSPSRQINSIDEILSILSTSHDNRELIPEYFTSPEFLLNMNYIYFGYRLNDKVLINDVKYQDKYFINLAQYVYYNRLILNLRFDISDINKPWYRGELAINKWIDLIFGYKQWNEKPKRDDLNLFGKYCYKQYINFDIILERLKKKYSDEKTIISKIESKKSRILNFGQCPEVLFNKSHKDNYLNMTEKGDMNKDDLEGLTDNLQNSYFLKDFKNLNIATIWISQDNDDKISQNDEIDNKDKYIYLLAFEEIKINNDFTNNSQINQFIIVYKDVNERQEKPDYIIKINEINLFSYKAKTDKKKAKKSYSVSIRESQQKAEKFPPLKSYDEKANSSSKRNESKAKDYILYYNYRLSPKYCVFDICCEKRIYFFTGRNIDNTIKVYEIELNKDKEGKLKYNIPIDIFTSCIYKKDKYKFFSGHKNGKIYEWKIEYEENKKDEKIKGIEIIRDLMAHKESMICCIYYIEKHNLLLTSSNDGKLFIRKYFDFELLSVIQTQPNESIIKFVYSDYDLLYLLTSSKGKDKNKSIIHTYTLNGLLLESSQPNDYIDIEPMKNGKLACNTIDNNKLEIFGFNEPKGSLELYDILNNIFKEEEDKTPRRICNFVLKAKLNLVYILLDNYYLYRQQMFTFNYLYMGIKKLDFMTKEKEKTKNNNKEKKEKNSFDDTF